MKDFLPRKESLELKELGLNEPCFGFWSNRGTFYCNSYWHIKHKTPAPTFSQAFRFFREKYKLIIYIQYYVEWNFEIFRIGELAEPINDIDVDYIFKGGTYEQAELECLRMLIKIVKENRLQG